MSNPIVRLSEEEWIAREEQFAELFVKNDFDAGVAALAMGLKKTQGYALKKRPGVQKRIGSILVRQAAPSEQIYDRYVSLALRSDLADFAKIISGEWSLEQAQKAGLATWMIDRCKVLYDKEGNIKSAEITLQDRKDAMTKLGQMAEMFGTKEQKTQIGEIHNTINVNADADVFEALIARKLLEEGSDCDPDTFIEAETCQ